MKATLILENGMTFTGESIGSTADRICEMVFNTSMVGYQEILTDPSYAGQGIVMSYPLIGNYGVNSEDNESSRPWGEAFVVRHLSRRGSNFRCEGDLDDYLKEHGITGIQGVDTRAITRILRSQGTMNGMITCAEHFSIQDLLEPIRAYRVQGTVERVSREEVQVYPSIPRQKLRVALMDFGVKENMIRCLQERGCEVTVFPAHTTAVEVLAGNYRMALGLMIIWGVAQLLRQVIQPKFVGDSIGVPAIPTLFLLFIGYRIGSVLGMILAVPVGIVVQKMFEAGLFDTTIDSVRILLYGFNHFRKLEKEDLPPKEPPAEDLPSEDLPQAARPGEKAAFAEKKAAGENGGKEGEKK